MVLAASAAGAFAWTATYVGSVASAARHAARAAASRPASPEAASAVPPGLPAEVGGAVWTVRTFDVNGEPSAGSAFAVTSDAARTLLISSYSVVSAATYQPAPPVEVSRPGIAAQPVTVRAWDPAHDLALLVLARGDQPVLRGVGSPAAAGEDVFAVAGTGAIAAGKLQKVSSSALEDNARVDGSARGGPLVDSAGEVLGVDPSAYEPAAAPALLPGSSLAVPVQDACAVVVVCPGGRFPSVSAG